MLSNGGNCAFFYFSSLITVILSCERHPFLFGDVSAAVLLGVFVPAATLTSCGVVNVGATDTARALCDRLNKTKSTQRRSCWACKQRDSLKKQLTHNAERDFKFPGYFSVTTKLEKDDSSSKRPRQCVDEAITSNFWGSSKV